MDFVIYDLEANHHQGRKKGQAHQKEANAEIIEIGACKIQIINGQPQIVDHFSSLVKPTLFPKMSNYITRLTKISQKDVDNAPELVEVFYEFVNWIGKCNMMIAWGTWDKSLLYQSCERIEMNSEWFRNRHVNIQLQISKLLNVPDGQQLGLMRSMEKLNIEPFGGEHSAAIDSLNTALVFMEMFDKLDFNDCGSKSERSKQQRLLS